jgi:hypothetical protein
MRHLGDEVQIALIRLNDALCTSERETGRRSILIIREEGGWFHRSQSGKPLPITCNDISDHTLLDQIAEHHQ